MRVLAAVSAVALAATFSAATVSGAAAPTITAAQAATAATAAPAAAAVTTRAAPVIPLLPIEGGSGDVSQAVRIAVIFTALALLPTILLMMTSFIRMVIVLHFVRQALGTQTTPPNQILLGLSLFLTMFVMYPTGKRVYDEAVLPYQSGNVDFYAALDAASDAPRQFMVHNTREKDLFLFVSLARLPHPKSASSLPMHVVIPSFVLSELRTSFQIGFLIFLPFLVIDLVVSAVLLSSGMMMLPPVVISFPFKILLFVLVDGWYMLVGSLVKSFHA